MSKRIGLIFVLLIFIIVSRAQEQQKFTYPQVDINSYELYQQKKWEELIDYTERAREQGIDFFYLQVRTGIAFYNLKKYRSAAKWLLKAWENDKSFDWLQEYLYYSLVFGGRATEASKIAGIFLPHVKEKIGYADREVISVALEGGYCFNPDFEELINAPHDEVVEPEGYYGEAFYLKNYHFESFDFTHRLAPGFSLNHNLTYIGVKREERIDWGSLKTYLISINQFQYFLNPHFVLGRKLYVSPSLSAIWGNYELFVGRLGNNGNRLFSGSLLKYSDFIFSTSLWSHFGNFSPGAELNFANINDGNFIQASAWLTFYPLSNVNFYITPRVYYKGDKENSFGFNAFGFSGGVQMGLVHFYGNYLRGEMENFIESAGYVVSNFPGTSENKFSGSFYFPKGKKYQFVLRYIVQDISETYRVYNNGTRIGGEKYNYVKHTLTGGISWNF
jgi:hypothetical protein